MQIAKDSEIKNTLGSSVFGGNYITYYSNWDTFGNKMRYS